MFLIGWLGRDRKPTKNIRVGWGRCLYYSGIIQVNNDDDDDDDDNDDDDNDDDDDDEDDDNDDDESTVPISNGSNRNKRSYPFLSLLITFYFLPWYLGFRVICPSE